MVKSRVKIFVCGSMCEGMVHYDKVEPYVIEKTEVIARGQIHRLPVGFHVFIDEELAVEGTFDVAGLMLTMDVPPILLQILDEFHGVRPQAPEMGLHLKRNIVVVDDLGVQYEAETYSFNPQKITKTCQKLESGNWRQDFAERPPITVRLTERQAQYIQKLGQSTGREIVPIDLKLYRELMNLDLIVDKGRRLALSKLGKEAFRYMK